jgi:hypothetical protein
MARTAAAEVPFRSFGVWHHLRVREPMRCQGQPCDHVSHCAGNPHDQATQLLVFKRIEAIKASGTFLAWIPWQGRPSQKRPSVPVCIIVVNRYAWDASVHY